MNTHLDGDTSRQETLPICTSWSKPPQSDIGYLISSRTRTPHPNIEYSHQINISHQSKITFCFKWPYFGLKHVGMIQYT